MAQLTLEMLQQELAPIRADLDSLKATVARMAPNVDGIPLLQRAVAVLQADMLTVKDDIGQLKDDMSVVSALTMRLDNTRLRHERLFTDILTEVRSIRAELVHMEGRVRTLEEH